MPDIEDLTKRVDAHHAKLNAIEHVLASTPDPKTLREMEHKSKETPAPDLLKEVVKARAERSLMYKRVVWGVMATVLGTVALATMSLVWQGIALALQGGGK